MCRRTMVTPDQTTRRSCRKRGADVPAKAVVLCVALAVALLLPAAAVAAPKRVALVIGNAAYQKVPKLANPVNDANAVARMLQAAGFEQVEVRQDLSVVDFKRAVRDFFEAATGSDVAVVYYAGHGVQVGDANYLIPVDARLASEIDVQDEAVSLDRILTILQPAKMLRLVILDACRDNPFLNRMKVSSATRSITRGLARVEPENNTLVAFAAKGGQVAQDGTGGHSPFTAAIAKHLAVPGLDIRLALGRVRDEVLRNTSNRQEPFVYGSLGGDSITLVPAPSQPTGGPLRDVKGDYELVERIGTRKAWEAFLASHKEGLYAELARAQLEKLTGAVSKAAGSAGVQVAVAVAGTGSPPIAPSRPGLGDSARIPDVCGRDEERLALLRPYASRKWAREELKDVGQSTACDRARSQAIALLVDPPAEAAERSPSPQQAAGPLGPVVSAIGELRRLGCQKDPRLGEGVRGAIRRYLAEKGRSEADIRVIEKLLADLTEENRQLCPDAAGRPSSPSQPIAQAANTATQPGSANGVGF
jgi:caspase domain-containing protein